MEIYKDIPGHEGRYQISNYGNCRSVFTNKGIYVRKPYVRKRDGYITYNLAKPSGGYINSKAHQLVAKAFIDNPNNRTFVNHIDGNPKNNHVSNLEWCTHKENMHHAHRLGLINVKRKVEQFSVDGVSLNKFDSLTEARLKTGVQDANIHHVCNGKRPRAGGYIWKYVALLLITLKSYGQHDGHNLHYLAGAGISIMTGELALSIKDNNAFALSTGIVMGTCAGLAKEHWDRSQGREFSNMDAMVTTWGALNGAIMLRVIIDIREKKREKKYYYYEGLD